MLSNSAVKIGIETRVSLSVPAILEGFAVVKAPRQEGAVLRRKRQSRTFGAAHRHCSAEKKTRVVNLGGRFFVVAVSTGMFVYDGNEILGHLHSGSDLC